MPIAKPKSNVLETLNNSAEDILACKSLLYLIRLLMQHIDI